MNVRVALTAVLLCACASDQVIGPPDSADAQRIAPRLAVVATAIGVAAQGGGFLDNFLPCGRRGIINFYSTSPNTRNATFSGCSLGDSITVDGVADVSWSGTRNQQPSGPTNITLAGDLIVTVGSRRSRVRELVVDNVQFADPLANIFRLRTDSLRIEFAGLPFRANSTHAARGIIDPPGLPADPIPAVNLNSLTTADIKRIAFDGGLALAWYMAINVRPEDPGPIVLQTSCGLTHVHWDSEFNRTQFRQEWQNCRLFGGMLISGTFEMRMPGPFQPTTTLQLVAEGPLIFGGSVAATSLTRLDWSITVAAMPGTARIAGVLMSATQQRQFSFDVYVDD